MSIHKLGENLKIVNLRFESLVSSERCKTQSDTVWNYVDDFFYVCSLIEYIARKTKIGAG